MTYTYADFQNLSFDFVYSEEIKCVENWKKESCFLPGDEFKPGMTMYMNKSRDSDFLERINAEEMSKRMKDFIDESGTFLRIETSHWACGWLEGYLIKVVANQNLYTIERYTIPFLVLCQIKQQLNDYPVLSDDSYYEACYSEMLEQIESVGKSLISDKAPENWIGQVYDLVSDTCHEPDELFDEDIQEAIKKLGWLELATIK